MFANKNLISRGNLVLAAACLTGFSLPKPKADAGTMESVSKYSQYQALSNNPKYKWAGAVTMNHWNGITYTASCVAVAPTVVIGAGHFTPGLGSASVVTNVTFGASCKSGERLTMEVERWELFPGYVFGDKSTTDLGVYYLKKPIPNFSPVTFGSSQIGDIQTQVDFGNYGDTTTGELPSKGDRFAGNAIHIAYTGGPDLGGYPLTKYAPLSYSGGAIPNRTQGLQFSSGAPWFDEIGRLTHITIGGIRGQMTSYTLSLKLNTQEIQDFLQPKIQASWASLPTDYSEPPKLSITKTESGKQLSWDDKASGWVLEKSSDLVNWAQVGNIRFGAGSFLDTSNASRQYFRLRNP